MQGGQEELGDAGPGPAPRQAEMLEQKGGKPAKGDEAVQSISRDMSFSSLFRLML